MSALLLGELLPCALAPVRQPGIRLPTPLDERADIGSALGERFYVKREDLLDDLGTGHKSRKLAYVAADFVAAGADVLITGGSLPSGQCAAVAALAQSRGIRAHLVYCGDEQARPRFPSGSYLLALLMGPTISWYEREPWAHIADLLAQTALAEESRGARAYIIPPGLDAWPGILGSIELGLELAGQLAAIPGGGSPSHVVAPAGSGTTCLGLSIAARLLRLPWTVHGMCIGGSASAIRENIASTRSMAAERLAAPQLADAAVTIHGDSLGRGYDQPTGDELAHMRHMLRRFQLPLDPNYMLKTFLGLRQGLRSGAFAGADRIILVHTGGNAGVVGGSEALTSWLLEGDMARHIMPGGR